MQKIIIIIRAGTASLWSPLIVTAFYTFVDADVGYPGRSGDSTVLRNSPMLATFIRDRGAWLGHDGVILGDGGASDISASDSSNRGFLNLYHAPSTAQANWFNFCHSSMRFFVEETFGR